MIVQPNKAIVGANAFAHEAGIHQVPSACCLPTTAPTVSSAQSPLFKVALALVFSPALLCCILLTYLPAGLPACLLAYLYVHHTQDGVLKNPLTYEIMTPESVGLKNTNLVLGKHSGRAAFQDRMNELGFDLYAAHHD